MAPWQCKRLDSQRSGHRQWDQHSGRGVRGREPRSSRLPRRVNATGRNATALRYGSLRPQPWEAGWACRVTCLPPQWLLVARPCRPDQHGKCCRKLLKTSVLRTCRRFSRVVEVRRVRNADSPQCDDRRSSRNGRAARHGPKASKGDIERLLDQPGVPRSATAPEPPI